jgi:hypothetical protein
MIIDELKRQALQMDPSTRAGLARDLLTSLDDLSEAEVERLWLEEAVRRDEEMARQARGRRRRCAPYWTRAPIPTG